MRHSILVETVNALIEEGKQLVDYVLIYNSLPEDERRKTSPEALRCHLVRAFMKVIKQWRDIRPMHPFSLFYLMNGRYAEDTLREFAGCKVPPESQRDREGVEFAIKCLPVGNKTYGLRIPKRGKLDLLVAVYREHGVNTTLPKMVSQYRQVIVASEHKLIRHDQAVRTLVRVALVTSRQGIDSAKHPEIQEIKKAGESAIMKSLEKTFMGKRKNAAEWGKVL